MGKKWRNYTRVCRRCKLLFKTSARMGKVCSGCNLTKKRCPGLLMASLN